KQAMLNALQPLRSDSRVKGVETPFDGQPDLAQALTSTDGHHLMAVVSLRDDYATARQYYPQLRAEVTSVHLRIYGTGNVAIGHDFDKYLAADLQRAELVSLLIIVPLLLLVFATVISMLLPLGVGGLAVVGGLAAVGLLARVTDVSTYATNLVTLLGLVVAIAVLYALTFLSALLAILGHRVNWLRLPLPRRRAGRGLWHGLAMRVMRRPILVLVPVLAILGLLASPFFQIQIANGDVGMLPPKAESRVGYDLVQKFPGQGQTYFSVVVNYPDGHPLTRDRVGNLYDLTQRIKQIPGVEAVEGVVTLDSSMSRAGYQAVLTEPVSTQPARFQEFVHTTTGPNIVTLTAVTKEAAESDGARAIVRGLRSLPPPA